MYENVSDVATSITKKKPLFLDLTNCDRSNFKDYRIFYNPKCINTANLLVEIRKCITYEIEIEGEGRSNTLCLECCGFVLITKMRTIQWASIFCCVFVCIECITVCN